MMKDTAKNIVRYGLLSTAKIGLNAHLPASHESKNSEIISISSRTARKAEAAAEEHGLRRWYASYEEQESPQNNQYILVTTLTGRGF